MLVDPDRGVMRRKWRVDRTSGPCVYLAEKALKKLVQHGWPAKVRPVGQSYVDGQAAGADPVSCFFVPARPGQIFGAGFHDALALAARIVAQESKCPGFVSTGPCSVSLRGTWHIDHLGRVREGPDPHELERLLRAENPAGQGPNPRR